MSGEINISKYATTPFSYTVGDTFKVALSFNYDVSLVLFEMKIYDDAGTLVKTYNDANWTLTGTRKKTLSKTYADLNQPAGTYRLVITHTFPDAVIRKRFDSKLTIHP